MGKPKFDREKGRKQKSGWWILLLQREINDARWWSRILCVHGGGIRSNTIPVRQKKPDKYVSLRNFFKYQIQSSPEKNKDSVSGRV